MILRLRVLGGINQFGKRNVHIIRLNHPADTDITDKSMALKTVPARLTALVGFHNGMTGTMGAAQRRRLKDCTLSTEEWIIPSAFGNFFRPAGGCPMVDE